MLRTNVFCCPRKQAQDRQVHVEKSSSEKEPHLSSRRQVPSNAKCTFCKSLYLEACLLMCSCGHEELTSG